MTPESQRIAIAEACGFVMEADRFYFDRIAFVKDGKRMASIDLPDFPNDLNAMHDACGLLAAKGWRCVANMGTDGTWECFFTKRYSYSCLPGMGDHYGSGSTLAVAIGEAFLSAIGKWEENPTP